MCGIIKAMSEELFDVLDEKGNKTGITKPRSAVHRDGDWHKSVHIWIIRGDEILLQRRAPQKDSYPNMLDISAAGHLDAGEDAITGAMRELKEELGIDANPRDFELIGRVVQSSRPRPDFINNEFNDIFVFRTDKGPEDMTLQKEEVSEVVYVPFAKFKEMIDEHNPELLRHDDEFKILFDWLNQQ